MGKVNEFSARMRKAMKERHMLAKIVGETVGASPSAMSGYATGKTLPPLDTAVKIAQMLEVSLDWLCGLSSEKRLQNTREISRDDAIRFLMKMAIKDGDPCITSIKGEEDGSVSLCIKGFLSREEIETWSYLHKLYGEGTLPVSLYCLWFDRVGKQEDANDE